MSANDPERQHTTVLLAEAISFLAPKSGEIFIDATLGLGGHAEAILSTENTSLIGIDSDAESIVFAKRRLQRFANRARFVHTNFAAISDVEVIGNHQVDGIIADLGLSSMQLDTSERGFGFRANAPLDMRMDRTTGETAAELLARLSEEEIANLIYRFGEERFSRRVARRIVERRERGEPVTTTEQLAEIVERSVKRSPKDKIHPATRTFQALRIAVNREIDILEGFIADAVKVLKENGRLVIISFHSLEDRIVKQSFQKLSGRCQCPPRIPQCVCGAAKMIEILTRRPVTASEAEIIGNPRARSAKLRAARRIVQAG